MLKINKNKNVIKLVAIMLMAVCMLNLVWAETTLTEGQMDKVNEIMTAIVSSEEEKVVIEGFESFDELSLIRSYIKETYYSNKTSFSYSSTTYYEKGVKMIKATIRIATSRTSYEKYCSKEFVPVEDKPVEPEIVVPEIPTLAESVQVVVDDIMTTALTRTGDKVRINDVNNINDFKEAKKYIQNEYLDNRGYFGYTAKLNSNTNKVEVVINADSIREAYETYGTKEYVIENYLDLRLMPYAEEIMTKILTYKTDAALITEFNSWEDWDAVKAFLNAKYFNKTGINYLNASVNRNTGKILVRINVPMSKANYIGGYTINENYVENSVLNSTETYTIRNSFDGETAIAKDYKTLYIILTNFIFKQNNETIDFEYSQNTFYKTHSSHYVKLTVNGKENNILVADDQVWNETMKLIQENYFKFSDKNIVISGTVSNVSNGTIKGTIQVAKTIANHQESEANKELIKALAESFDLTGNKVADLITINNYLSNRNNYAYNSDIGSITTFLNDKVGNCFCYSKVMELICEYIGIECETVGGEMISGTGHVWNSVIVDGNTYYMDLTWNKGHTYWFLMDRTTFEIDHIFD